MILAGMIVIFVVIAGWLFREPWGSGVNTARGQIDRAALDTRQRFRDDLKRSLATHNRNPPIQLPSIATLGAASAPTEPPPLPPPATRPPLSARGVPALPVLPSSDPHETMSWAPRIEAPPWFPTCELSVPTPQQSVGPASGVANPTGMDQDLVLGCLSQSSALLARSTGTLAAAR